MAPCSPARLLCCLLLGIGTAQASATGVTVVEPSAVETAALAQELTWWRMLQVPLPLEQTPAARHDRRRVQIEAFYAAREDRPAWIGVDGPRATLVDLLAVLRRAPDHGLVAAHYRPDALERRAADAFRDREERLALEIAATEAALHFADDLALGRVDPGSVPQVGELARRQVDVAAGVAAAVEQDQVIEGLLALAPAHPDYETLRQELVRLRAQGPDGSSEPDADPPPSGRTVQARIDALVANLERWRWLPDDLGDPHVQVDIARQVVELREGHRATVHSRVIVGTEAWPTPLFSDSIEQVVINPSWRVPNTIEAAEMIPKAKADPGRLADQGFYVHHEGEVHAPGDLDWSTLGPRDVRFVQGPGPANALGRIKIDFPNAAAIYLHDTPQQGLFAREQRNFSHGCIRVEQIHELAAGLLSDWDLEDVEAAIASGRATMVALDPPVPVHLLYWTAAVGPEGGLQWAEDVYGVDATLLEAADALSAELDASSQDSQEDPSSQSGSE